MLTGNRFDLSRKLQGRHRVGRKHRRIVRWRCRSMLVAGDRHVHLLYQIQQFAQYLQHIHLARSDPGLGRFWSFTNDCNWPVAAIQPGDTETAKLIRWVYCNFC